MLRWFQGISIGLAVCAGVLALLAHRQWFIGRGERWGTRATLLLSLAIIVGTAPAVLVPSFQWARWAGLVLSLVLTLASLALIRRQYRVLHS
jgi:hypothetical protein